MEVVFHAGAGHTGGDLSCLNTLVALYFHTLNISAETLRDPERDRFILSKGHCVEALYTVLEAKGILKREVLDTLGRYGSPLAGHPTVEAPGVEVNSGALGHGLAIGVGIALAAKMDGRSYRTFVLMGDGEQGEGSIYEAAMAAHQYHLDNLVAIIDRNHLQISGDTEDVMAIECIKDKWTDFGWSVSEMDGDDVNAVADALDALPLHRGKPQLVISHTTKGRGVSYMEGVAKWHHGVPTPEQYEMAVKEISERIAKIKEGKK